MGRLGFTTKMAQMLVIFSFFVAGAAGQEQLTGIRAEVTVSGEGVIKTLPDMAIVEFAVVSRNERPDRVRTENEQASAAALNAIRGLGVEEKDIKLQNLNLNQLREYDPDRRTYTENGFEATRSVTVTVIDLDSLPDLIAALISNGANRMNSIQYGLDDRDDVELEVLRMAVARARTKATVMVAELGRELGVVLQISEQGISIPSPVMRMEVSYDTMSSKSGGDPDAYASGQIEVRASVTVVFQIK
jgi:uncharacterized protein